MIIYYGLKNKISSEQLKQTSDFLIKMDFDSSGNDYYFRKSSQISISNRHIQMCLNDGKDLTVKEFQKILDELRIILKPERYFCEFSSEKVCQKKYDFGNLPYREYN